MIQNNEKEVSQLCSSRQIYRQASLADSNLQTELSTLEGDTVPSPGQGSTFLDYWAAVDIDESSGARELGVVSEPVVSRDEDSCPRFSTK